MALTKVRKSTSALVASDVGAVPVTLTINGQALSGNITLSAADVGALTEAAADAKYPLISALTTVSNDLDSLETTVAGLDSATMAQETVTQVAQGATIDFTGNYGTVHLVFLNGIMQSQGDAYTIVTKTITFAETTLVGDIVTVFGAI